MVDCLRLIRRRFEAAGLDASSARDFLRNYERWRSDPNGLDSAGGYRAVAADEVVPIERIEADAVSSVGKGELRKTAWIVLNGGLGTTMRMEGPKSLLPVRGRRTFLDLLVRYTLRRRTGGKGAAALVFMNSFATDAPTREALAPYRLAVAGADGRELPVCFLQSRYPRIREADGSPFGAPDEGKAWAPPGHGDLYDSLDRTGMLDRLLDGGWRYAFVSNADNLGATPSAAMVAYMKRKGIEFAMEVTARTEADVKGGGPVWRRGRLTLLEAAQAGCASEPRDVPYFNTNNLWIDLDALRGKLRDGGLDLPLIVNRKTVDGERVVQIETAAGAAIGFFERSLLVAVDRRRFAPVKTTEDLLARRSDLYREGTDAPLEPSERDPSLGTFHGQLDPRYFDSVDALDLRMPEPPSLIDARSLTVIGDVRFGRGVRVRGDARVENRGEAPLWIPDGTELSGEWE